MFSKNILRFGLAASLFATGAYFYADNASTKIVSVSKGEISRFRNTEPIAVFRVSEAIESTCVSCEITRGRLPERLPPASVGPPFPMTSSDKITSAAHRNLLYGKDSEGVSEGIIRTKNDFDSDPRTEDSDAVERNLYGFLYSKSNFNPKLSILSISCRSNLCEIQASAYSNSPMDEWSNTLETLRGDLIWNDFSGESSLLSDTNGQSVIVTYLRRKH